MSRRKKIQKPSKASKKSKKIDNKYSLESLLNEPEEPELKLNSNFCETDSPEKSSWLLKLPPVEKFKPETLKTEKPNYELVFDKNWFCHKFSKETLINELVHYKIDSNYITGAFLETIPKPDLNIVLQKLFRLSSICECATGSLLKNLLVDAEFTITVDELMVIASNFGLTKNALKICFACNDTVVVEKSCKSETIDTTLYSIAPFLELLVSRNDGDLKTKNALLLLSLALSISPEKYIQDLARAEILVNIIPSILSKYSYDEWKENMLYIFEKVMQLVTTIDTAELLCEKLYASNRSRDLAQLLALGFLLKFGIIPDEVSEIIEEKAITTFKDKIRIVFIPEFPEEEGKRLKVNLKLLTKFTNNFVIQGNSQAVLRLAACLAKFIEIAARADECTADDCEDLQHLQRETYAAAGTIPLVAGFYLLLDLKEVIMKMSNSMETFVTNLRRSSNNDKYLNFFI